MRWILIIGLALLSACVASEGQRVPDGGLGGTGHGEVPDCPEDAECVE